jgi:hypothetical protein
VASVLSLALGAGFALSYLRAGQLEQRLDQAHMQQRSTDVALTKLEQRAEALKGELKQSDQDRRAQQERFEAELAERAKVRAAEEQAVEKVLGVRYTKLRTKLTNEANGVTPAPSASAAGQAGSTGARQAHRGAAGGHARDVSDRGPRAVTGAGRAAV